MLNTLHEPNASFAQSVKFLVLREVLLHVEAYLIGLEVAEL
jgi:hypothetical protein